MAPFNLKFLLKTHYKVPLRNTHEAKKGQRHQKLKENSKVKMSQTLRVTQAINPILHWFIDNITKIKTSK